MADGEVKIDTKLDNSGLDKGIKDLNKKLDDAGKSLDTAGKKGKLFNTNLVGIGKGAVAAAGAVAGVGVAVKKTVDALNDCAAAYRQQTNAEEALQIAAKNNPYLNDESVYNLRNFASELQSMSEIGDEVSLQVMSQLAATGRTEEQIMQIMSAAADMAAVTGQDIVSAAQQLNATLNGNAGALGRQIGAINNLTKEELENGKAIELVAQQYKGAAAATADVEVQLSNAWGDFKENIGRGWQQVTQPVKQFFLDTLDQINEAVNKTKNLKDAAPETINGEEVKNTITNAREAKKAFNNLNKNLKDSNFNFESWLNTKTTNDLKMIVDYAFNLSQKSKEQLDTEEKIRNALNSRKAVQTELKNIAKDEAAAKAAAAKAAEEENEKEKKATEIKTASNKAIKEQTEAIKLRAQIMRDNNEVDADAYEAGEMYNAYLNSYIELLTNSNGLITKENQAAKDRLANMALWAGKIKDAKTDAEKLAAATKAQAEAEKLLEEIKGKTGNSYIDDYKARVEELDNLRKYINDKQYDDEVQRNEDLKKLDEEYAQNKKNLWANITADINGYIEQTADIAQQFGDLMLKNVQTETDLELAKLEEKYEKGEMSEEEYYEKQKAIKRKAAQEEYKIQMFQWSASILAATANIAQGVSKAIAEGGTAGLITGALVGAAGAVQIASIIASKPVPPQFYAGGIIGGANGATYGSDNTYIHARTGEMILNAHQQRSLWDMINGQDSRQQAGLNLTVNNTQSNRVDTNIRQQNNEILIDILDKHINKGLTDGVYDAGLAAMNTRQEGVRIL